MVNFIVLLILHLIGDFYLQTTKIAKCKNAQIGLECKKCSKCKTGSKLNITYMLLHTLLYIVPFLLLFFITDWLVAIISLAIIFVSHALIDTLSCCLNKKLKQTVVFIVDQFIHVVILFFIYKKCTLNTFFNGYIDALKIVLIILVLIAPCSILINKIFKDIYPDTKVEGIFDVGSIIGIIERFLVFIFAYFGNFAAIAIIITVKTWARNEDLKDKSFRNKYLLGTLASLTLALAIFVVFKKIT